MGFGRLDEGLLSMILEKIHDDLEIIMLRPGLLSKFSRLFVVPTNLKELAVTVLRFTAKKHPVWLP